LASSLVDAMVTVSTDEICQAIQQGFNATRTIMEPAGSLAIAGAIKTFSGGDFAWCRDPDAMAELTAGGVTPKKAVVAITSGANMDFTRLRFISERADASETLLAVEIPERPGAFRSLYSAIFPRNVTEFSYRYGGTEGSANIIISFQARGADDLEAVTVDLAAKGFGVTDMGQNELCKAHVRYLAGGRSPDVGNERLFRFEFPEQPGALSRFLESLDKGFNVSLFHYRNHGDDFGRVLVGIQPDDKKSPGPPSAVKVQPATPVDPFEEFLDNLGYNYIEETDNPARTFFL